MDNTKAMLRQYSSIRVQLKSVGLLVSEIERLSDEVIAKIVDKAGELTVDEFLIGKPDFSSSYPDEYEDLYLIGKKVSQGMSELRSSLDYFIRFLVYANGETPHKYSEFPVIEDENCQKTIKKRRIEPIHKRRGRRINTYVRRDKRRSVYVKRGRQISF